ncbi:MULTISPECIES: hypothetical protein [unclassified Prevotella]|uniref:hypothetical protein n=1 Tax=unclassified Prevotella TaxID=2638335 RepID=UPI001303701D|nr:MULTISPECIES: hypothetical protein [unclassified Prevotella]
MRRGRSDTVPCWWRDSMGWNPRVEVGGITGAASQLRELIEVKEVITSYGRSGS